MIPNQWYPIFESHNLARNGVAPVIRMGRRLVLWRGPDGGVSCMEDRCPHRGVALSMGRVVDGKLACGYHGLRYDSAGQCVLIPCAGEDAKIPGSLQVPTYPITEDKGFVWLWWGERRASYPAVPWFDEIPSDPRQTISKEEVWPFNYARLCENHMDAHHWAYVHRNVMVGVGEHLSEFHVDVSDDETEIRTWGKLHRGSKPESRAKKGWDFECHLKFPNLTLTRVTPRYQAMVIQTPMDEQTSWVVVRIHQTYSRLPLIRGAIDRYCRSFLFSVPMHRQDFPLFFEQRPIQTGVGVNKLVGADAGIAQYLRIREKLIKRARAELAEGSAEPSAAQLPEPKSIGSPLLPVVPPADRDMERWRAARPSYHPSWLKMYLSYPLLVPSLISAKILSIWHRP